MRNTAVLCALIMLSQVFCIGCGGTAETGETGSAAAVTAQAASEGNTLQSDGPASVEEPGRLTAAGQEVMPEGAVVITSGNLNLADGSSVEIRKAE